MDNVDNIQACFNCGTSITSLDKFCPHCGISLSLPSTTIARQIFMYLVSFFLPPFGLRWIFKYFKSPEQKAHIVAWIIIGLTLLSIIISIWITLSYVNGIQQQISNINLSY